MASVKGKDVYKNSPPSQKFILRFPSYFLASKHTLYLYGLISSLKCLVLCGTAAYIIVLQYF